MPMLDVTEVLTDPLFNETIFVKRRQQVMGTDGRATLTETNFTPIGVVTAGSPDPMLRTSDYTADKNTITVHTQFRLIDATSGVADYQPDVVTWLGSDYIVKKSWNWSKFGAGFIAAECELIPTTTVSP